MHHRPEHQTTGIYEQEALAPVQLLGPVVAARPSFSVVFAAWLSAMPAPGCTARPARPRTGPRRSSLNRSLEPVMDFGDR
ncbi:MAG: hypothetical protein M3Q10_15855, partial [Chloroflexota bacterium]|nr:hypothetical protein [Chloroflexota bacterium]